MKMQEASLARYKQKGKQPGMVVMSMSCGQGMPQTAIINRIFCSPASKF